MFRVSLNYPRHRRAMILALSFAQVIAVIVGQRRPAAYQAAYVDPGSGLFALQILVSSVLGALYLAVSKLRALFGSTLRHPGAEEAVSSVDKCADDRL